MTRRAPRALAVLAALLAFLALVTALPSAADAATSGVPVEPVLLPVAATSCPAAPASGAVTCLAQALPVSDEQAAEARGSGTVPTADTVAPMAARSQSGSYTPGDLASLYRIPSSLKPGATIGIVDVGRDPNTVAQMAYFRAFFHLPACTTATGCFREVAEDGSRNLPPTDTDWVTEIAIDVQAVTAICPTCHILLVDADSAAVTDMAKAALTATKLGATYLSLSYGSPESASSTLLRNTYYGDPDVTYVAATGDSGSGGYGGRALFPSSASNVVAVGGTRVTLVNGTWHQSAWTGAGSGCSTVQLITALQIDQLLGSLCGGKRAVSDLSALADPATGMLFYRGGSWWSAGGTSLAAPIVTGLYALAGNHTSPMSIYHHAADLLDVTSGSTGSCLLRVLCTAVPGWDGPTGLGTPEGLAALAAEGTTVPAYSAPTAGVLTGGTGYPVRLTYRLADTVTGAPVTGVTVTLQRRGGGGYTTVKNGRTDRAGTVVFTDSPRSARTYRVAFAGGAGHLASSSNVLTVARFRPTVAVTRRAGHVRASVRAPWGAAARSVPVQVQVHRGRRWATTASARTNARGTALLPVRRGVTFRLQYGGGVWTSGHTKSLRAR